ncbi:MAG: PKD domain-containing protein, partial [Bacteroidia bacterium]
KDTVANSTVIEWVFDKTIVNTGRLDSLDHRFTPPEKRFLVKVKRKNNITGKDSVTEKVIVIIDEKANFTTDIINLCKGKTANFTTIGIDSTKIKTYTWDFGDSTAFGIIENNLSLSGPYNNGNTSHTYFKNGVFDVKLIIKDKFDCLDSLIFKSIIVKGPVAGITANPLKICGDSLAVTFNDSSFQNGTTPIKKWFWNFGDNSKIDTAITNAPINHTYHNNTYYSEYTATLTIEDAIGCTAPAEKVIKIYKPTASFDTSSVTKCKVYDIDLHADASNVKDPAQYIWDYGDASKPDTFNTANSTHTYLKDGSYTIKLKVIDENNCVDSLVIPNHIKIVKPLADFSFKASDTCQCSPVSVTFISKSKYAIKQQWYINRADAGTDTIALYQFTAGYDTVKLVVVGPDGCVHDTTQIIHIKGPIAKVDVIDTQGCAPFKIKLSVTGSNIEKYNWTFGDGNGISTPVPFVEYTYTEPGKYIPTVILISPETCPGSKTTCDLKLDFPEVIVDALKSDFVINPFPFKHCDTANIQFTTTSVVPNFSSVVSTKWLFGDGTIASGNPIPSHVYSSPGTYYIKMIDSSRYGCKDTAIKSITIGESPKIEIIGDSIICLTPLSKLKYKPLIKNLKTSLDTIATYQWSVDGKVDSTDSVLELNYRVPGVHEIQLLVTTNNTCSAIATKKIVIDSIKAQFTSDTSLFCGKGIVAFKNQTASAFSLEKYNWNFGNGITFNGKDTSIIYNQAGNYVVNLYATSQYGCKDTVADTVKIFKKPLLFIKDTSLACTPSFQLFKSTVGAPHDSIVTYNWSVNGLVVGNKDSLNKFFNAGNYEISLNIKTDKGCVDTIKRNIKVDSLVTNFDVLTPNLCGPSDTAKFKNQSVAWSGIKSYLWNYGDNTTATGKDSIHIYTNPPKSYDVSLIINSVFGCADTVYKKAIIQHDKSLAVAINGVKETCVKNTLLFKAIKNLVDSIKTYQWVINNDTLSTKESLSHYFSMAGNYQVKLYATSIHNCKGDTTISVTIHPSPIPAVSNDTVICVDESVQLLAHDGIKYSWLPVIALTNASIANPLASPIKNTEYIVTVTNQFTCEAKDTVNIKVDERVEITAKEVAAICSGESVQLNAYGNTNKFKWIPNADLNDANIANPVASPPKPITYHVIGYSANSCPDDTAKVLVRVNELPKIELTADTTIIIGVPIQLNAIVNNLIPMSYLWTPSNYLSCVKCPNPLFTGSENSIYFITVKSEEGCIATDTINIHLFCEDGIFVPNAFTPNGDGLNDVFYPQSKGYGLVQSLLIFNRWGELVFEQKQFPLNDPTYGWDGTFKGNKIQGAQVFVYAMKVKCLSGKSYSYTGKVTIVQ